MFKLWNLLACAMHRFNLFKDFTDPRSFRSFWKFLYSFYAVSEENSFKNSLFTDLHLTLNYYKKFYRKKDIK